MNFKLLLFISLLSVSFKYSLGQKKLICYYTNWSQYRPDIAKFVPEDIDPLLCTHIIYAFAKINVDKLAPYEWNDESVNGVRGMFQRVTDMKARNPNLKVLLAVGGWTFGSPVFSKMVSNPISRATFIYTSINYLKANGFDGIDLDWE